MGQPFFAASAAFVNVAASAFGTFPTTSRWMEVTVHPASVLSKFNLDKTDAGWTVTSIHLDVVGKVPKADAATFTKAAEAAKKGCPISRLLNTTITMSARLS